MKAMKLCYSVTEEPTNLYTDIFIILFKAIKTIIIYILKNLHYKGKETRLTPNFHGLTELKISTYFSHTLYFRLHLILMHYLLSINQDNTFILWKNLKLLNR